MNLDNEKKNKPTQHRITYFFFSSRLTCQIVKSSKKNIKFVNFIKGKIFIIVSTYYCMYYDINILLH